MELQWVSQRSKELDQELVQVMEELQNARLDSHETKRQLKRRELLEKLHRLYPETVVSHLTVVSLRMQYKHIHVSDFSKFPLPSPDLCISCSQFGRLSDLCSPTHKKYQLAVTKVFGSNMNAIVVASEKVARDCISFIKGERAEPETLLPVDYLVVS